MTLSSVVIELLLFSWKSLDLYWNMEKWKFFHFSRVIGIFDPPPLNLSVLGGLIL